MKVAIGTRFLFAPIVNLKSYVQQMSKKLLAVLALGAPVAALADGYTVPTAVTTAVTDLEGAATGLAGAALPAVAAIGLPFVGIAVIYLLFRVLRKFASGK